MAYLQANKDQSYATVFQRTFDNKNNEKIMTEFNGLFTSQQGSELCNSIPTNV